jgi:hypothetical protein
MRLNEIQPSCAHPCTEPCNAHHIDEFDWIVLHGPLEMGGNTRDVAIAACKPDYVSEDDWANAIGTLMDHMTIIGHDVKFEPHVFDPHADYDFS